MDMRLYFFECGTLRTKKHYITMNKGLDEDFEIPVPFFLIRHPKGNVLFDTGNALNVARDPLRHWGSVIEAYAPVMTEEQYVVNQLKHIDMEPEAIDFVVLSHLHLDHAGGVGAFPNARYIVQRKELEWAYVPDYYQKAAYIRADFDKDVDWMFLYGSADDPFDIFGDGKLKVVFTPGHTPGHQSLKVDLPRSGVMFLTGDACYTTENLDDNVLPGLVWSPPHTVRSIERMRYERDVHNANIITGHDPRAWPTFKKAPAFYD